MNALVKAEYDKLAPHQQVKFQELLQWHRSTQKDEFGHLDNTYFKFIEWAKRAPAPEPVPETEE